MILRGEQRDAKMFGLRSCHVTRAQRETGVKVRKSVERKMRKHNNKDRISRTENTEQFKEE